MNIYIIRIENKIVQIDTGYHESYSKYKNELKKHGLTVDKIDFLILTHAHDDHAGFLQEFMRESKAKIILNIDSIERLKIGHNLWIGGCSGYWAYLFVSFMALLGKGRHEYPKTYTEENENVVVFDGKEQPKELIALQIKMISLPGHTADSIGVVVNNDILFCGDAAMNGFPSIKRKIIWIEDLKKYKESWKKMIREGVRIIYPGHGRPFPIEDLVRYFPKLERIKLRPMKEPEFS